MARSEITDREFVDLLMLDKMDEEDRDELLEDLTAIVVNRTVARFLREVGDEDAKKWVRLVEAKGMDAALPALVEDKKLGKMFIEEAKKLREELVEKLTGRAV